MPIKPGNAFVVIQHLSAIAFALGYCPRQGLSPLPWNIVLATYQRLGSGTLPLHRPVAFARYCLCPGIFPLHLTIACALGYCVIDSALGSRHSLCHTCSLSLSLSLSLFSIPLSSPRFLFLFLATRAQRCRQCT